MISKKQFGTVIFIVVIITALLTWAINNFVFYGISDEMTGKFRTMAGIIQRNSYKEVDDDLLQDGSIQGMVASLNDPDSVYLSADEVKDFENQFLAEYTGIGVKTTKIISGFMVVDIADKSPAKEADIKLNDIIIKINNEDVRASSETMSDLLRKNNSLQSLTVLRDNKEIEIPIVEATADFTTSISQIHEINNKKVLVFDLQKFTDKTVSLFENDLKKLQDPSIEGVVIDLRNNSGGSVDIAKKILELTVSNQTKDGIKVNYLSVQDRNGAKLETEMREKGESETNILDKSRDKFTTNNKNFTIKQPTVVLVNEKTASAAEMVAAAMHEINEIPLIGNSTYGKGTVQEIIPIVNDGSALKLTTKKWFTPLNNNLTSDTPLEPETEYVSVDSVPYTILTVGSSKEYKNGDKDTTTSTTISNTQMILSYFGYNMHRTDGLFDDETEIQLKQFQKDNGIKETGRIDTDTLRKINENLIGYTRDINNDETIQKAFKILEEEIAKRPAETSSETNSNESTNQA